MSMQQPCRYALLCLASLLAGHGNEGIAATPIYNEANGLVVMEAEQTRSPLDLWQRRTDIAGYTGSGHLEFTGNSEVNGPARSPLLYRFRINRAGNYRLILRGGRTPPAGTPDDQANDCYVRVSGDYSAGGSTPLNWLNTNTKFFGAHTGNWGRWTQTLDKNHEKKNAEYNFKAGEVYDLVIHGRSRSYNFDRVVFYRTADHSLNAAKNTALPESATDGPTTQVTLSGERKRWHKLTLTMDGPQAAETGTPNPFLDYRMTVTFTHVASNRAFVVPGYFAADGDAANSGAEAGNKWRAHLSPHATGQWTYAVAFHSGSNCAVNGGGTPLTDFHGLSGHFSVAETDKTGRDMRAKGRLQYLGGHYLRFAGNGEYFLKQGPDAPENLLAYADFDGPFKTDGQKDNFIKTWSAHVQDWQNGDPTWQNGKGKGLIGAINYLASEGLNVFSFLPMNIAGDDRNVFPYLNYNERKRMDCSRLDQWEILFAHGTNLGFFLHFKTQETENELLLDNGNMGVDRKLYYRELIARFSHHLALNWNLGEEINNATTAQKKAWAQYFYDHDPYRHHLVIHNGSNHYDLLGTDSRYTGFSLQTNQNTFGNVHNRVKEYLTRSVSAGKPWAVACDEPGDASSALRPDADAGNSHRDGRKNGIWGTFLAGGWGNEWYFGYRHAHSDLTCQDFRSRDAWWDYCRYALEFFKDNDIPFWLMRNDNALSSAGDDYCFFQDGQIYIVYLKNGGSTQLNLTGQAGAYSVRWFNPRSGGSLQNGTVGQISGGASVSLGQAPGSRSDDWVVLVKRIGSGGNQAPIARAGVDQGVAAGAAVGLDGRSSEDPDDGPASLSYAWAQTDGPNVNLSGANTAQARFTAPASGTLTFSLTVSDGAASSTDTVVIRVQGDPGPNPGPAVLSLSLINATSNQPIAGFDPIPNGARIDLEAIGTDALNLRANVSGNPGSVRFGFDGNANHRTESVAPFALFGDSSGDYLVWTATPGGHSVTATPFTEAGAGGQAGSALVLTFTIVEGDAAPQAPTGLQARPID